MRQIKRLTARLTEVGDYAIISITVSNITERCIALRFSGEHIALYSKNIHLGGLTRAPREPRVIERFPFLREYNHTFCVCYNRTIGLLLNSINALSGANYEIVTDDVELVNNETELIAQCESTTQTAYPNRYIQENYSQQSLYVGMQRWHFHHGQELNKPIKPYRKHRIGIELEVEFNSLNERDEFINIPSNWFYRESDASLNMSGCEIITIPLLPKDAKSVEFWESLTSTITNKANSWDSGRCGLHVHIGREILGTTTEQQSETIGKLLYLYHHYLKDTRFNTKIYGRERGYHDNDAKSIEGDAVKTLGGAVLKDKTISNKVKTAMLRKSDGHLPFGNGNRYFDINLQNEHTIEFRKGRGSINPQRIAMVVEYCELMAIYAKQTPWMQINYDDFIAYLKGTASDKIKSVIRAVVH